MCMSEHVCAHTFGHEGLCMFMCAMSGHVFVWNCGYNPTSYLLNNFYVLLGK